jgi:Tfp pilus assembly protein PilN
MKAVNLIPADAKRGSRGQSTANRLPTYLLLGALAAAVALVTVYVLATNDISQRQAKVATLQAEVAQTQARSAGLSHFAEFSHMTESRIASVRQLAATRFDWHATLAQISQVVPANTSLATLNGTAASSAPGATGTASPTSAGTATGSSIELAGCTKSQDDVARLMSRLRLVDGVDSVTLNSSQKQASGSAGAAPSSGSASGGGSAAGGALGGNCGNNAPAFDLKILFASQPATPASGAAATTSTAASTTPSASGAGGKS